MTHQRKFYIAGFAVLLQLFIIVGLFVRAWYPLVVGQEVRVKTVPVDPRSLFRGNYAQLNYDFSRVPMSAFSGYAPEPRSTVYVILKRGEDGLYALDSASLTKPERGVFIRGKVKGSGDPLRVNYGIDAFFAPKAKALKMESDLRNGGVAVLKVSASGRAAIDKIVPSPAKTLDGN